MAEAVGKLTGRPGICFVTRGPGSSHAAIGIHTARQDSTPLIVFVGQAARDHLQREAFQEVDYGQMFGKFAKWVTQIDDPARIPELVGRAFHVAVNGRPGPGGGRHSRRRADGALPGHAAGALQARRRGAERRRLGRAG